MLEIGQVFLYGIHGVCRVSGIAEQKVDRKMVQYYVLTPLERASACFYVPVHNEAAVSKLRPLLTREELEALMASAEVNGDCWIADENRRKLRYRELIGSGDRGGLVGMVRTLYRHKEQQLASGRKFHVCDENFLRDAEKMLSAEFSLVLGIPADKIGEYLLQNRD